MAKTEHLFPYMNTARYGENRRRRPLFLPKHLNDASSDKRINVDAQERAYQIILRWADLESSGKLKTKTETGIEGEFLTEVFGQALGYTLFSENKQSWEIEPKFSLEDGQADAAIGLFKQHHKASPLAVIELKGSKVNLDKDRFNGRTAVQQCWDYLYALPNCPWGIVCNYVSFRLYHRDQTPRAFELFTLKDLTNREIFNKFYCLFQRDGLLPSPLESARAETLLEKTSKRQREVGDELYRDYDDNRLRLIKHLNSSLNKPLDKAIRIAQKLIDRIIFVAFCEDRGLLPENSIKKAWNEIPPFHRVTNPRWQNFIDLFRSIDEGNERRDIAPYNGGLFRKDSDVDDLNLEDEWTDFFKNVATYDFRDEINVDVLGHLFEKSINDIERIRLGGLFESNETQKEQKQPKMEKSAERKKGGIYYTPPEFTGFIVDNTIAKIADRKVRDIAEQFKIDPDDIINKKNESKIVDFSNTCIEAIRQIKVVDPACGSGAFLIRAYECLEEKYLDITDDLAFYDPKLASKLKEQIPDFILHDNIFGVDLSPESVEITQLALWIRSAHKGKSLADLSKNIVCGNSLVADPAVHPLAMDWQKTFPQIFSRQNPGFDCVIGNPPWERLKLQNREFFAASAPHILETINPSKSRELIAQLEKTHPELYQCYITAKENAENTLDYVRTCGRYKLTGKGDINTYAVFAELAKNIVSAKGKVGLLVPSGIATDHTTKDFFAELTQQHRLAGLYDFENKLPIFPDVHRSYKFCILLFGGKEKIFEEADFVFFAREIFELKNMKRHISLSAKDFSILNPNTQTCPVFRSNRDAEITKSIYHRVPVLIDENRKIGGNPWGVKFVRMFDQSNDAELFRTTEELKSEKFKRDGAFWKKGKQIFLPLYEAKMIQMYDHRAASILVKSDNYMRQGQTEETTTVLYQNPEFSPEPRWWINIEDVANAMGHKEQSAYITFKDVTSSTNLRTMIAAFIPYVGVVHTSPLILTEESITKRLQSCLLANLNSFAMDFVARQKVGGIHLTFFIVEQLPIFPPDFYSEKCPWDKKQTLEKWISECVLKLTCTSNDMIPLAKAVGFDPPVHKWKQAERLDLMAQLDAAYFILYGIERDDVNYILSTFSVGRENQSTLDSSSVCEKILSHYDALVEKIKK